MKKLFLSSSFADISDIFEKFVGEKLKGKIVTCIPTASFKEDVKIYVDAVRKAFEQFEMEIDELDISTAINMEIFEIIQKNNCIYIAGGNTFYLL